jgi:recombinational DNA repair protein (RecF pathway)
MNCLVCGASAQQISTTIDGMGIVCPACGEYDVSSSVLATEQLQRLEPDERSNALSKAKRLALQGARPIITTHLLAAHIELGEQSAAISD